MADLRRELHGNAEPAGEEVKTRAILKRFFLCNAPGWTCRDIAGGSLAWIYEGPITGSTLILRCELDAVPLAEDIFGNGRCSHCCGHDGHMAILAGLALVLARERPVCGRVMLLFQAAEENGSGAKKVVEDKHFLEMSPDFILALHNLPQSPLGQVVLRSGTMCCASRGLEVLLKGKPGHAAHPETGCSPAPTLARIMSGLEDIEKRFLFEKGVCMATIIGARLGEKHFGCIPEHALLWATLRADSDQTIEVLSTEVVEMVVKLAAERKVHATWSWQDVFPVVYNDGEACALVRSAAARARLSLVEAEEPFRWSEDFAHYGKYGHAALVGLGSGESCAALHTEDYVFPDELLSFGVSLLYQVVLLSAMGSGKNRP